jgi:hypothetical protein
MGEIRKPRGRYLKPTRQNAIDLIKRKIIDENYSPEEVRDMLKIPDRSFQRYLHMAFEPEKEAYVKSVGTTNVLDRVAIMEGRLTKDRRDLINLIHNPNIDPKQLLAIVEAYKLASSLNVAISKIHEELLPRMFKERAHMDFTEVIHITDEHGKRVSLAQYFKSLPDEKEEEEGEREGEQER